MKKGFLFVFVVAAIFLTPDCSLQSGGGGGGGEVSFSEVKKLAASDAEIDDWFGDSVSVSGDYAIVGAPYEDGVIGNRGAAYIYYCNQGGSNNWGEVTKLMASDAENTDLFGYSVAISGDYAIVGAYYEDGAGSNRGAAYIFNRDQGGADNWGEVKKLTASDAADDDYFGCSVAISGDYAVAGAFLEDGAGSNRGAAYIFNRDQGGADNWGEVTKLTASDAEDTDQFGRSVAISGDYAIVGAWLEDGAGSNRGAAYIYHRDQGGANNWGEVKKLTASDAANVDYFGCSVAISEDHAIVGAEEEDGAGSDRGAVYIFNRDQGGADNWGEVIKLTASDAADGDIFGSSVAISVDYVIVGAELEDGAGSDRGAVYIYYRNQGGSDNWGEVTKLTASDAADDDYLGCSVAMAGDYAIVGAYGENGTGTDCGAAYVYKKE
ncbi:MAG: FG-GAP repeat protein [Spirochaetales bacterium]|nr:FG-GAP repeat protein [Spirochaetales bacterium]